MILKEGFMATGRCNSGEQSNQIVADHRRVRRLLQDFKVVDKVLRCDLLPWEMRLRMHT